MRKPQESGVQNTGLLEDTDLLSLLFPCRSKKTTTDNTRIFFAVEPLSSVDKKAKGSNGQGSPWNKEVRKRRSAVVKESRKQ